MPFGDGHPFIVYDGTTINFPTGPAFFQKRPRSRRTLYISHGKVHSLSLRWIYDFGRLVVENFEDAEIERQLYAWWSWAVRGNVYQVAFPDPDPLLVDDGVIETTITAVEPPGSSLLAVTPGDGLLVKKAERYDVREAAGHAFERIATRAIASPPDFVELRRFTVTKYGYAPGDKITHRGFFPRAVSLDDVQPWGPVGARGFTFDHRFREVA